MNTRRSVPFNVIAVSRKSVFSFLVSFMSDSSIQSTVRSNFLAGTALPNAALVYDHFHVSKVVHDALEEIRRRIQRQLPPAGRRILKGQRYVLLRARESLSNKQQVSLREVLALNTDLTAGHILKESFRDVFRASDLKEGRKRLQAWEAQVRESGVPELLDVLKTIERRRKGIENYFRYHVANGMAEGFNNVVGTIKKQAYGFHDRDYLRLKILRICGKLGDD